MGPYRTMAQDIVNTAWEYGPQNPDSGPMSHIKHFCDRSHLVCRKGKWSAVRPGLL